MKLLGSILNGRLENEVDNFIAILENEFSYKVEYVKISYRNKEDERCLHEFIVCEKESSSICESE